MKKTLYLCILIIINMNVVAQIDPYDRNWDTVFYDGFSTSRTWDSCSWYSTPGNKWKALAGGWITHGGKYEHQLYQYQNCVFDTIDGTMKLVSEYDWDDRIPAHNYSLPNGSTNYPNYYGSNGGSDEQSWYFFSGEIDVNNHPFHYGYFEIRCKLPIHAGSFPAFWLFGGNFDTINGYYNEIDVFEYSNGSAGNDFYRRFTCGLYCDNDNNNAYSYARVKPILPADAPDLRHYHVFGCEWLPNSVIWSVDGNIINEFHQRNNIPHHAMELRTNYAINNHVFDENGTPRWFDGDTMTIDYIKVLQLETDCGASELITNITDLFDFRYAVKQSIVFEPSSELIIPDTIHSTMRAVDSIVMRPGLTIPSGVQMSFIIHDCPN